MGLFLATEPASWVYFLEGLAFVGIIKAVPLARGWLAALDRRFTAWKLRGERRRARRRRAVVRWLRSPGFNGFDLGR